jgi:hypothetical protein
MYDNKIINFTFFIIFMSNILINIDHGSLPACVQDIQMDLGIHDFQFGILGSLVYAGITIGSAISSWIF